VTQLTQGHWCGRASSADAGSPARQGRLQPRPRHRELGKYPPTASDGLMLQVGGRMHRPLLTVDGRYRPMVRARWGHGRSGPTSRGRGCDDHQLDRRARPVHGGHLPRWQGPQARGSCWGEGVESGARAEPVGLLPDQPDLELRTGSATCRGETSSGSARTGLRWRVQPPAARFRIQNLRGRKPARSRRALVGTAVVRPGDAGARGEGAVRPAATPR